MKVCWYEWNLALLLAALMVAMVLWPAGPRSEDVRLEVVSVQELPAEEESAPQQVEVQVRWHWLRPPRRTNGEHAVALTVDMGRWSAEDESDATGDAWRLLHMLNGSWPAIVTRVEPGQDGERTFVLSTSSDLGKFDAQAIALQAHYIYKAPNRWGWPGRTWVHTVEGVYPLKYVASP